MKQMKTIVIQTLTNSRRRVNSLFGILCPVLFQFAFHLQHLIQTWLGEAPVDSPVDVDEAHGFDAGVILRGLALVKHEEVVPMDASFWKVVGLVFIESDYDVSCDWFEASSESVSICYTI